VGRGRAGHGELELIVVMAGDGGERGAHATPTAWGPIYRRVGVLGVRHVENVRLGEVDLARGA